MESYLKYKYLLSFLNKCICIFLTIIFVFFLFTKSYAEENVFTINSIKVKGRINLEFSRDKYLNEAFLNSFDVLMSKILLIRDLEKVRNTKLKQVKNLISSFQIVEESYRKEEYNANIKIFYNEKKIKDFLGKKNISFSQAETISVILFPAFIIDDEVKSFRENFFYNNWNNFEIQNESINFILPLDDLEDISKILEMKDKLERLNVSDLVNKYDVKNYVFMFMTHQNGKLTIHLKINFNSNKISKNISYNIKNIKDEEQLINILKDLKLIITDIWKEQNLLNVLLPLSIKLKFEHTKLKELDKLRQTFNKINIIDDYKIEKFDINNSFFKIYYYGNPKKLRSELLKFGYLLSNKQGFWQLNLNE